MPQTRFFAFLALVLCFPLMAAWPDPSWEIPGLADTAWRPDVPWDELSANDKAERILEVSQKSEYKKCPFVLGGQIRVGVKVWRLFFSKGLERPLTQTGDEFVNPEYKTVHGKGYIMRMKFIPAENTPFTGLWAKEGVAIGRVSTAGPFPIAGVTGLAVKHLRNGTNRSVNYVVMNSLDAPSWGGGIFGQPAYDPKFPYTNVLPIPSNPIGRFLFDQIQRRVKKGKARTISVEELSLADEDGVLVKSPHSPERIILVPEKGHHGLTNHADFRKRAGNISVGKTVWKVYGLTAEQDAAIGREKDRSFKKHLEKATFMGTYVKDSEVSVSEWQDYRLHFEHSARDLLPPKETAPLEKITQYIEAKTGLKFSFNQYIATHNVRAYLWNFIHEMEKTELAQYRMSWETPIELVLGDFPGAMGYRMHGTLKRYVFSRSIDPDMVIRRLILDDVNRAF